MLQITTEGKKKKNFNWFNAYQITNSADQKYFKTWLSLCIWGDANHILDEIVYLHLVANHSVLQCMKMPILCTAL
jgi:hypothetical protein